MKKSKIFCLAAVAVLLFTLAACGGYTSKIYDNAQKWIQKDVLESNMTKAPDAEDSDLPKEICRLIDSREKSDEYFSDLPVDVDFSKEKMILYFYTSQYMGRSYKINKMDEMGNTLYLYIKPEHKDVGSGDASVPAQRCLLVVTNKTNVKNVNVVLEE